METILETPRVRLRKFTLDDSEALFRMGSDPEIIRYTGDGPMKNVEEAREAMKKAPLTDYEKHGYGRWAFVLKEIEQVIGFCGIKFLPEFAMPEIGYRIFPEHWGKGLMTEAAQATLSYGHEQLELPKIIALVMQENARSIRVVEKLGMTRGELVQYHEFKVWQYEHEA